MRATPSRGSGAGWMGARLTAALLAGRMATGLSRRLGRGGGTVIAGHVVPRIDPTALRTVTRRLRHGSVLVSGTNGKTTTTRLISHILQQREIRPRAVLLTNIFRDQLDRYGEVHFVADLWAKAIRHLPLDTTMVLNADDPLVATLGREQ